jgi:hypothetical protein
VPFTKLNGLLTNLSIDGKKVKSRVLLDTFSLKSKHRGKLKFYVVGHLLPLVLVVVLKVRITCST